MSPGQGNWYPRRTHPAHHLTMLVVGLTGSIATGKSTVSQFLAQPPFSFPIVDADKIAREVVLPGTPTYDKIVAYYGPRVDDLLLPADEAGRRMLNRPALGRYIFAHPDERKQLNAFTHPSIRREMARQVLYHWLWTRAAVVVLDIPLLYESGLDAYCGTTMVVACAPEVQKARLMARDGASLTEAEADNRIGSQMPVADKAARADVVVWNDGDRDALRAALTDAVGEIMPARALTLLQLLPPIGALMAAVALARRYLARPAKPAKAQE
ncbi:dephospho-CoA kinase-domain-containing protein [Dipodascopsis tothii]|uniref:dephospho-CoA kinase-domain-containing protein n=1 Tax=Dipodascopsis tothii TaxID=44089 RepID=UPI0034CE5196